MKNMQSFYSGLFGEEGHSPDSKNLRSLTGLNRSRFAEVSNQTTWFIWSDEKPKPSKKSPDER